MYRTENIDVLGKVMPTLVFEPEGAGPHPWLVIAQHLPVAHAGLEKDPFTIAVGDGQVPCEFHRYDGRVTAFRIRATPSATGSNRPRTPGRRPSAFSTGSSSG